MGCEVDHDFGLILALISFAPISDAADMWVTVLSVCVYLCACISVCVCLCLYQCVCVFVSVSVCV